MSIFTKEMEQMMSFYERQIRKYKHTYENAPEGRLLYQKRNGKVQMLQVIKHEGKRVRKGINTNDELIRGLAQKEFARKSIDVLEHDLKVCKAAAERYIPYDPDEVIKSMTKAYGLLPEEHFFDRRLVTSVMDLDESDMEKINRNKAWGDEPYRESMFHAERKTLRTSKGKYVRSKSELLIIESLYDYGIPMHYDEEHLINGVFLVPDFTFMDRSGRFFFWEYMGMMDDPGYAKRNLDKLDKCYRAGIVPGDNLIVTFDKGDSINMSMIEAIIRNEIIPKL